MNIPILLKGPFIHKEWVQEVKWWRGSGLFRCSTHPTTKNSMHTVISLCYTKNIIYMYIYGGVWRMNWGVSQPEDRLYFLSAVWWHWWYCLPDGTKNRVSRLFLGFPSYVYICHREEKIFSLKKKHFISYLILGCRKLQTLICYLWSVIAHILVIYNLLANVKDISEDLGLISRFSTGNGLNPLYTDLYNAYEYKQVPCTIKEQLGFNVNLRVWF